MPHVSGDICATHRDGNRFVDEWYTECKNYHDLGLARLLTEQKGKLAEFWLETMKQSSRYDKLPLLVWKQDRHPIMVGMSSNGANRLGQLPPFVAQLSTLNLWLVSFDELLKTTYS